MYTYAYTYKNIGEGVLAHAPSRARMASCRNQTLAVRHPGIQFFGKKEQGPGCRRASSSKQ